MSAQDPHSLAPGTNAQDSEGTDRNIYGREEKNHKNHNNNFDRGNLYITLRRLVDRI